MRIVRPQARVQVLLESLLQARELVPDHIRRLRDHSELSSVLQKAMRSLNGVHER